MIKNFNIKKAFWFTLGCILLGVAFVGVYLPGLPWSTPAVGAAYCFAKSSDRMHNWIMNHKLFGPFLRGWSEKRVFPTKGIRVRAICCNHYSIADDNPENGFLDISVRLREGRDIEIRKKATQHIFEAAKKFLNSILENHPFALSLEMRNIDPELSPKINSIPNYMKAKEDV